MIYLLIIILLLFLIFQYDINNHSANKESWYTIVLIIFICLAGFRYRIGSDTVGYLDDYYHDNTSFRDLIKNFSYDSDFFSRGIILLFKSLGVKFYIFQLAHAIFVNVLLFNYFKKHAKYWFTCLFFYFIWMYSFYNTEELRATLSVVLYLYAFDLFFEKKWIKGYLLILIGCLLHKSTYVLLITPLLLPLRLNIVGLATIIIAYLGGMIIKVQLGDYLDLLALSESSTNRLEAYMNTNYWDQNANIFSMLVLIVPFIVYPLLSFYYIKKSNYYSEFKQLEPLLIMGLICVAAQASVNLFYRYVHFYAPIFIIYFAHYFISLINSNKKKLGNVACVIAFAVFLPLLVAIARQKVDIWSRYYPYSSVFERSVDRQRELDYSFDMRVRAKDDEY